MHPAWTALRAHHDNIRHVHVRQLFADDPGSDVQLRGITTR